MPANIRVLVVDDSALIRQMLTRALSLDPRIEVVGSARTGVEAVEKARVLEPDVITLDIQMPEMSGLEALPFIVRSTRARVIMLSSLDDPDVTYQALERGAVDFITKPTAGVATSLTELTDLLLKKIRTAHRVDPSKRMAASRARQETGGASRVVTEQAAPTKAKAMVVVAASTGGPPALEAVFSGLGSDLPCAFLVVQHLPAGFTGSLARRLSSVTDLDVREAEEGMQVRAGGVYVAPHGAHMSLAAGSSVVPRISLQDGPLIHGVKPSADPLFKSTAEIFGSRSVGVILTGMGSDGAEGLGILRKAGAETIVQDEQTSVVWGMPGAAIKRRAAKRVMPLKLIAPEIRRALQRMV
ncbi:MAG: chemotaxis response regulator protein-glutamate methylesterase [Coriobacteriia bacterium]|nr:chemotaxis response regulator protein-glutamate methylesterase [Coriobacteriia bacterium]